MPKKDKLTWNLKLLFKSDDDPAMERELKTAESAVNAFVKKWKGNTSYLKNTKTLKSSLDDYEKLISKYGSTKTSTYIQLRNVQDQSNSKIKAKLAKVADFETRLSNGLQFYELSLGKITTQKQKQILKSSLLKLYKHFLERVFASAKYNLSEAEEKILSLKSMPASLMWKQMTAEFLAKETRTVHNEQGKVIQATEEEIMSLMSAAKRKVRDEAAKAFNEILFKYREVATAEINAIFSNKKIDDELRGYNRVDQSRHISDDISSKSVDGLIKAVSGSNKLAHDFYKLKAQLFKTKQLAYHERNLTYGKLDLRFSYGQASKLVENVFAKLDPEFGEIFRRLQKDGQLDVYPRKGKRSGAFCAYDTPSNPTFVMLNFIGKLSDVKTLAHEMGHAVHGELMRIQNALNYDTSMATAEVASQFMEDFVLDEIRAQADEELNLALLMRELDSTVSSVHRQIACYQFEQALHQAIRTQGYLSADEIGKLFQKYMFGYMGSSVARSDGSENWWVYWIHIRSFFYNYSYGGGLLIAKALQKAVRQDPKFVQKIKNFLAAGMSASTEELFKTMDVDITKPVFWQSGLNEVKATLLEATQLAKKLDKI